MKTCVMENCFGEPVYRLSRPDNVVYKGLCVTHGESYQRYFGGTLELL